MMSMERLAPPGAERRIRETFAMASRRALIIMEDKGGRWCIVLSQSVRETEVRSTLPDRGNILNGESRVCGRILCSASSSSYISPPTQTLQDGKCFSTKSFRATSVSC